MDFEAKISPNMHHTDIAGENIQQYSRCQDNYTSKQDSFDKSYHQSHQFVSKGENFQNYNRAPISPSDPVNYSGHGYNQHQLNDRNNVNFTSPVQHDGNFSQYRQNNAYGNKYPENVMNPQNAPNHGYIASSGRSVNDTPSQFDQQHGNGYPQYSPNEKPHYMANQYESTSPTIHNRHYDNISNSQQCSRDNYYASDFPNTHSILSRNNFNITQGYFDSVLRMVSYSHINNTDYNNEIDENPKLVVLNVEQEGGHYNFECTDSVKISSIFVKCSTITHDIRNTKNSLISFKGTHIKEYSRNNQIICKLEAESIDFVRQIDQKELSNYIKLPKLDEMIKFKNEEKSSNIMNVYEPIRNNNKFQDQKKAYKQDDKYMTLESISAYTHSYVIRCRVIAKDHISTYNSSKGEGQIFKIELKDRTGVIQATFFGNGAGSLNSAYNDIIIGKVYEFNGRSVREKNQKYNSLPHPFELQMDDKSIFKLVTDDGSIPNAEESYIKIADLKNGKPEKNITICGVISSFKPETTITTKKTGTVTRKKEIYVVDDSKYGVWITVWSKLCSEIPQDIIKQNPIVTMSNLIMREWRGYQLSTTIGTKISLTGDGDARRNMDAWWKSEGHQNFRNFSSLSQGNDNARNYDNFALDSMSSFKTISMIQHDTTEVENDRALDSGNMTFVFRGTIDSIVRDNYCYPACNKCRKKMIKDEHSQMSSGDTGNLRELWCCNSCNTKTENSNYKYVLRMSVKDSTGCLQCTAFDDAAKTMLNISANELKRIELEIDDFRPKTFGDYFDEVIHKEFIFKMRAEKDKYNEQMRIKYTIQSCNPVNGDNAGAEAERKLYYTNNVCNSNWE